MSIKYFTTFERRSEGMLSRRINKVVPLVVPGLLCAFAGFAQIPEKATIDDDSRAALIAAAAHNNLERDGASPWHIRAKYELFDAKGNPQTSGVYEEWWVNSTKNKRSLSANSYSTTDYTTNEGVFRIESGKPSTVIGPQTIKALVRPLSEEKLEEFATEMREQAVSNSPVKCITLTWRNGAPVVPITHMYCFDPKSLALQAAVSEYGLTETLYDNGSAMGDQYFAKEIRILHNQLPLANIHVEKIEALSAAADAEFVPPVDAKKLPPTLTGFGVPFGSPQEHLIRRVSPECPQGATVMRAQGPVAVKFVVNKDGRVTGAEATSGPTLLRQAAVNAVARWEYRPYVSNHEPIEMHSNVVIFFGPCGP